MSKTKASIPAGFLELLPGEQIEFNRMLDAIRRVFELFGFAPIETPAIEYASVLLAKGGGETEKQVYRFERGDKEYCLHFDLTIPLARYVAMHYHDLSFPFRRYQIQKVWRAERPQRGRFREFYQCDIDIVGDDNMLADAEMLLVTNTVFMALGFERFTIRVNNRKVLNGFIEHLGYNELSEQILRSLDKFEKLGEDAVTRELTALGLSADVVKSLFDFIRITGSQEEVVGQLERLEIGNPVFVQGLSELKELLVGVKQLGLSEERYKIDLSIARGLDYYTSTVYETTLDEYPEIGSVCSGGRYDDLTSLYGEVRLPGVGISIGLTRFFDQLRSAGLLNTDRATTAKVLIVPIDPDHLGEALNIASRFRGRGIPTEVRTKQANLGAQLKYAHKQNFPFVAIVGMDEAKDGEITLKDMSTSVQSVLDIIAACDQVGAAD